MKNQRSFISRMQEHLKNNQFHSFPQADIWGRRVEYDLDHREIRFIPEDEDIEIHQYSPYHLGKKLYQLHKASAGFAHPQNHPLNLKGKWSEHWFKRLKRIQKVRDHIYKQGIQSKFEELFLENYSYFNQLAQVALFYLEDLNYPEVVNALEAYGTLAYRSFSWDFVKESEDGYLFVRPESWILDIPTRDLGHFVKNSSMETLAYEDSVELLRGYQSGRELEKSEYHLIYASMLFPSRWVRLVEKYMNRQNYPNIEWEEEILELNDSYQEWERVLGEYNAKIYEEFGVEVTPVEWLLPNR